MGRRTLASIALLLLACSEDPVVPGWTALEAEYPGGLLLSVWGRGPDDVWVVGGRPGGSVVLHGDRGGLDPVDNPGTSTAWWVCGLGDAAVGVVGAEGLVMVDRGEGFERLALGLDATLYGCWGTGPDDFWVVGGDPGRGVPALAHVRSDGIGGPVAHAPDLGALVPQLPDSLYKVRGVSDVLWVVGGKGTVLRRGPGDDGEWTMERPGPEAPLFTVSASGPDDVWAVGGGGRAVALQRTGDGAAAAWTDRSPPDESGLNGVWAGPDRAYVSGAFGLVAEHSGGTWRRIEAPTDATLHAVWSDGGGTVWSVGGNIEETDPAAWRGVVVVR